VKRRKAVFQEIEDFRVKVSGRETEIVLKRGGVDFPLRSISGKAYSSFLLLGEGVLLREKRKEKPRQLKKRKGGEIGRGKSFIRSNPR